MARILALALVTAALGCSDKTTEGGATVCSNDQCTPGHACVGDVCRQLCAGSNDCDNSLCCVPAGYCAACTGGAAPEISAIDSDGILDGRPDHADHRIGHNLLIFGANLSGARVDLTGDVSYTDLETTDVDAQQIAATLPASLAEGTYTLTVRNAAGSDQAEVTVLQGQDGRDGTDITGTEIIARIETARGSGSTLTADRLGTLSATDVATTAALSSATGALDTRIDGVVADLGDLDTRVTAVEGDLSDAKSTAEWVCNGFMFHNVCVADYNRGDPGYSWLDAVNACTTKRADVCTQAQYQSLRMDSWAGYFTLFYSGRAVWTAAFSDSDGGVKVQQASNDDPSITDLYAYACCQNVLPEPWRSRVTVQRSGGATNGVWTTYVHSTADTTFPTAAQVCAQMGSDLCTKSQYVTLRDAGAVPAGRQVWTSEQSDNDVANYDSIVGPTGDNPTWDNRFAYACCASQRPLDNSCPGTFVGGVCTVEIHDTADVTFATAARACSARGADVCSKAQMQVLRNQTVFLGQAWTNDGADNDSNRTGGLLASQSDNVNPTTASYGYACCL
jgi:hypothetical protein